MSKEITPEQDAAMDKFSVDLCDLTKELVMLMIRVQKRIGDEEDGGVLDEDVILPAKVYWMPVIQCAHVMCNLHSKDKSDAILDFVKDVRDSFDKHGFETINNIGLAIKKDMENTRTATE